MEECGLCVFEKKNRRTITRINKEPTRGEGHYRQIGKGGYGVRRVGFEFWGEGLFSNNQKNL
jgi:hypothetical protein